MPPKLALIPEFSVKTLVEKYIPQKVKAKYMPENPLKCDRVFAWRLWMSLCQEKAESYYDKVMDAITKPKFKGPTNITISDEWMNLLLKYE